jgi:hypothetical protein
VAFVTCSISYLGAITAYGIPQNKKIKLQDPTRDKCRGLYVSGKSLIDGLSLKFFLLSILMIKKLLRGWCESVAPAPELGAYYSNAWAVRTQFLLVLEYY